MEKSIAELDEIYINAGRRGMLARMRPQVVIDLLSPTLVEAGN
jgi:prolyl-tRNA editing enzyme YbaK/EbsC (Cys-tRNA(Pro) deacylase)